MASFLLAQLPGKCECTIVWWFYCNYYHTYIHRLGASIVVAAGTVLPMFARNYYNPLCFIQYPHSDVPPVHWEQVRPHTSTISVLYIIISVEM